MSALDQAFIKAYRQEGASSCVQSAEPSDEEQRSNNTAPFEAMPSETAAEAPELPIDMTELGEPDAGSFRPLLQVDSFAWPKACGKLAVEARTELDRLADGLLAGMAEGCRVVTFSSCLRGEGCTTLLLSVAQRLSEQNVKLVTVDADPAKPMLCRCLGMMPEVGWEQVVAGRIPLAEALVESIEDRLAVLPSCRPQDGQEEAVPDIASLTPVLAQLEQNYELVLVDLGPLEHQPVADLAAAAGWTDAVVLVHNARSTPPKKLADAKSRLQTAGIARVGVVENFIQSV